MITVGKILKDARLKKNLSLEDIAKSTLIKIKFLKAVESGNWKIFPSKVYAQGIVKSYAKTLNEDTEKIMAYFRAEYDSFEKLEFREKKINENPFVKIKTRLSLSLLILSSIFIIFLGFQFYLFLKPPKLIINSPKQNNITVKKDYIQIEGQAEKDSQIKINDNDLQPDPEGKFSLKYPLLEDKNIIKIKVIGANGRTIEKTFTVIKQN
ncbi:MAG: hypothetical protein KatS3mg090_0223 [Patescibacteria group bacterium]|nr:MAG: hypothetical protein KatS3mg090_0223 [Patescibacteria group bacterium]